MFSDADTTETVPQQLVRVVEFAKIGQNCGFQLTRGKWDPYPWVSSVDDESVSSSAGLMPGDCILEVNGEDIVGRKISEVAELVKSKTDRVSLLVWNAGQDLHCPPEAICCGPLPSNLSKLSACMSTILAFLECPVCLDTIAPPTYQCGNGHLICVRCKAKSERCPVCRVRFAAERSLLSDKVYNAVIEAFHLKEENDEELRKKKIQQIFKTKSKNKQIPNIKITQCHTNKFLAKIVGKSSSVDNLSSSSKFLSPNNCNSLKAKSLSSNEIFQSDTSVSGTCFSTRTGRKNRCISTMDANGCSDGSLTNINYCGSSSPASLRGSLEHLPSETTTTNNCFFCPFDSKCQIKSKGSDVIQHFQTYHAGPLIQYFGSTVEVSIDKLEKESCFVASYMNNTFFLKTYACDNADNEKRDNSVFIWCWHLGLKDRSKSFEIQVELRTNEMKEEPFLRVKTSVFSLDISATDIIQNKKGIFLSMKTIESIKNRSDVILGFKILSVDL